MLDFRRTFTEGHVMVNNDIPTIMQCKDIDFGHVDWQKFNNKQVYNNVTPMSHIIDNILDANAHDNNDVGRYTFIGKILSYSNNSLVIEYVYNNIGINMETFKRNSLEFRIVTTTFYKQSNQLVKYLTSVSLGKFPKYYNIVKYYDMIYTMLLVTKIQKIVHNAIIKHLIIPFIYQL